MRSGGIGRKRVNVQDFGDGLTALYVMRFHLDQANLVTVAGVVAQLGHEVEQAIVDGPIALFQVASDDHLGGLSKPRGQHEHLVGRGVLHFVGDDEGALEGAAAHVGQGRDFDGPRVQHGIDVLLGIELGQDVEYGACPRIHFANEIAGQKADVFFHGNNGAGQNDLLYGPTTHFLDSGTTGK